MSQKEEMSILTQLRKETWLLYGMGVMIIFLRFTKLQGDVLKSGYTHTYRHGFRNFYIDDFLILYAMVWFTILCVFNIKLLEVASTADLSDYDAQRADGYSQSTVAAYVLSSKYIIVAEQGYENTIYTLKCCVLIYYYRFTEKMKQNLAVKLVALYVLIAFIATQFAFFFMTCPTFSGNWARVPPAKSCVTWEAYDIFQAPWNMSSDIFIMMIPIPLILTSGLSLRRKIVYSLVFGMGVFVIVAAFLNKWYNVYDNYNPKGLFWYIRETAVALYVANFLHIFPLILRGSRYVKNSRFGNSIRSRGLSMRSTLRSSSGDKDKDPRSNIKLSEIPSLTFADIEAVRSEASLVVPLPSQLTSASSMVSPRTSIHDKTPQKVIFREIITGRTSRNSRIAQLDKHYSLT